MKTLFLYIVEDKKAPVLAGLSAVEWLKKGAADTPYCVIEEGEAVSPPASDYFAVLRSSTPLITAVHLAELILEMEKRGYTGLEIGKGMLVKTTAYFDGFRPKRRANAPFARAVESALDLAEAEKALYRRIAELSVQNGAIIPDVASVYIDALSTLAAGVTVEPYGIVKNSVVEEDAVIGSFSEIENSRVGRGAKVLRSVVKDSEIKSGATVGPFAYVGDAAVGDGTNVGCGTVFANYDGKQKHPTTVGKRVFIGANTNLVAPLTVGDDVYIAAATTVTEDVEDGAFVIGRTKAEQKQKK